jgi:hypothetical protein
MEEYINSLNRADREALQKTRDFINANRAGYVYQLYERCAVGSVLLAHGRTTEEIKKMPFHDMISAVAETLKVDPDDVHSLSGAASSFSDLTPGDDAQCAVEVYDHLLAGHRIEDFDRDIPDEEGNNG